MIANYPQMVFESNLSKVNLGDLYLLTNRLDSAENNLNEGYRYFSEIKNNSAMHYIETLMIELSLKKGNIARAREMIARTASTGHVDANMLTIRNQYLQHYYEKAGDYRNAYKYLKRDYQLNDSIRSERIREGKGIRILVCDNGRGYLPQVVSSTKGTGTGLKVLYQTVQLLNTKNKNEKMRFDITNRNDGQTGTQVSVYIPFHFSYEL